MGRESGHTHRDDRPLRGRQRPDRRQELIRSSPIDDAQHGVPPLGQAQRTLPPILRFLVALDQAAAHQAIDEPAGRRWRPPDGFRQLADGQGAAVGEDVQRRELGEPQPELAELASEPDDELAPQCPAHGDALADLADIRKAIAGRQDRRRQIRFELPGDGSRRCRANAMAHRGTTIGHPRSVLGERERMQPCMVVARGGALTA
jgi:hypothetical protein